MEGQRTYEQGRVLIALLSHYLGAKARPFVPPFEPDLPLLLSLARAHDVGALLGAALRKAGVAIPEELAADLEREDQMAMFRYLQSEHTLTLLCDMLEREGIRYMPLKGAVLRDLWPDPYLRTSCDIDILFDGVTPDRLIEILSTYPNVTFHSRGDKDLSFTVGQTHVEMHWQLFWGEKRARELAYFSSVFDHGTLRHGTCGYAMDSDEAYVYLLAHYALHLEEGGCGIRQMADLYLARRHLSEHGGTRERGLAQLGLTVFGERIDGLLDAWFEDAPFDERAERLTRYILFSGVYGTAQNHTAIRVMRQTEERRGMWRVRYVLSCLFPPLSAMRTSYPVLKRLPILLPFCYCARALSVFHPERRRAFSSDLTRAVSMDAARPDAIYDIHNEMGLLR